MKILVVDDDLFARAMLLEALKLSGYMDVSLAVSAADALSKIESSETPFDCFLLDIQMDELDGIDLCRAIRAFPLYSEVPIVMVTAMHDKKFVDAAFDAGATDYVTKPFDMLELGTRVRIAENISAKIKKIARNEIEIVKLNGRLENWTPDHQENPINIKVEGFAELKVFEACLEQISATDLQKLAITSCRIMNFEQIEARCRGADLESLLANVVNAISATFEGQDFVTTYGGKGIFLGAFKEPPLREEQIEIQDRLNQLGIAGAEGYRGITMLEFGEPIWFNLISAQDPLTFIRNELDGLSNQTVELRMIPEGDNSEKEPKDAQSELENRLRDIVPHYLSDLNVSLARLDVLEENLLVGAINWAEIDEIKNVAHKISGVAPTLGFDRLGKYAFLTEQVISAAQNENDLEIHRVELSSKLKQLLDGIEDTIVENIGERKSDEERFLPSHSSLIPQE